MIQALEDIDGFARTWKTLYQILGQSAPNLKVSLLCAILLIYHKHNTSHMVLALFLIQFHYIYSAHIVTPDPPAPTAVAQAKLKPTTAPPPPIAGPLSPDAWTLLPLCGGAVGVGRGI